MDYKPRLEKETFNGIYLWARVESRADVILSVKLCARRHNRQAKHMNNACDNYAHTLRHTLRHTGWHMKDNNHSRLVLVSVWK